MSSLLQFRGNVTKRGVGLQFVLVKSDDPGDPEYEKPVESYWCPYCNQEHARIWIAYRHPAGMFGPWVVFRYNNAEHVPDLSIPISVTVLPRGARWQDDEACNAIWHGS